MSDQPSLGGQFDAWVRQGAKDLHNAIVPAFPESARAQDEPGTPLNPTPQMVTDDLGASKEHSAMLDQYAARGKGQEQQLDQGMER